MTMQAVPIPKVGICPSGYTIQGKYFVPLSHAKPAIARNGACPSGWVVQGEYCVATRANPKMVIPAVGSCPSGYTRQGNYFVKL